MLRRRPWDADGTRERQRAAQKEQIAGLYRLNVGAERAWRPRQVDVKVSQAFFGGTVRCVGGHD